MSTRALTIMSWQIAFYIYMRKKLFCLSRLGMRRGEAVELHWLLD